MRSRWQLSFLAVFFALLFVLSASFGGLVPRADLIGVYADAAGGAPAVSARLHGDQMPSVPYIAAGMMLLVNASSRSRKRNKKGHFLRGQRSAPHRRRKGKMGGTMQRKSHGKKRHGRRRHAIHLRHNPSSALLRDLGPVAIGAAGALGTDLIVGFIPWPAAVVTSPFSPLIKTAVKVAVAVGVGFGVGKALGRPVGTKFMVGALTVVGYGFARDMLARFVPTLTLGELQENDFPEIGFVGENFSPLGEAMPGFPALAGDDFGADYGFGEPLEQY